MENSVSGVGNIAKAKKPRTLKILLLLGLALAVCLVLGRVYSSMEERDKVPKIILLDGIAHKQSEVSVMNGKGQVAGTFETPGGDKHAFIWTPGKGTEDIGRIGSSNTRVHFLSEEGDIYGTGETNREHRLFRWTRQAGLEILGELKDSEIKGSQGRISLEGVSKNGLVALNVTSYGTKQKRSAFVWSREKGFQNIGDLGGEETAINSMNDRGQATGQSQTASGEVHDFLWSQESGFQDLGIPPKLNFFKYWSAHIDEQGKVFGWAQDASNRTHIYTWTREEGFKDLGVLGTKVPSDLRKRRITHTMGKSLQLRGVSEDEATNATSFYFWTQAGGTKRVADVKGAVGHRFEITDDDAIVGITQTSEKKEEVFYATKDSVRYFGTIEGFPLDGGYYIGKQGMFAGNTKWHSGVPWHLSLQAWAVKTFKLPDKYKPDLKPYEVQEAAVWMVDLTKGD